MLQYGTYPTDINNLYNEESSTLYKFNSNENWQTLHWPTNGGFCLTLKGNGDNSLQIWYEPFDGTLRIRGRWNTVWKDWKSITTTSI